MATWYFDGDFGSDSEDGSTPEKAKKSYDAAILAGKGSNGDTFLFKRGTTQTIITPNTGPRTGLGDARRSRYAAYGEAQVPYSIWVNPSAAGNVILNASGRSYIDFEDMYFDGQGLCLYSIYLLASGATANSYHRINRCHFTNMAVTGSGLVIGGTATSSGDTANFEIFNSYFYRNPTHGLLVNGAHDVLVAGCKFYGNGFNAAAGGHGFSAKARRTDANSGWTTETSDVSGKTWKRTLAANEPTVYRVSTSVSPYRRLDLTAGTQTNPGVGEFGVAAGVLYINVGSTSNPSGQGVNYSWGRCYNIVVEDCESYENIWDRTAPFHEGHGFAADDYTELTTFRRNYSHHNQGSGFSVNKGDDDKLEANIAHDNWNAALAGASCRRLKAYHNTFHDNNQGEGSYNGEIALFTYAKDGEITNNILQGETVRALDLDATCTGMSGAKNCVYGYSTVESGSTLTGTLLVDPGLTSSHRPTHPALLAAGSELGGRDFYRKKYRKAPNIGAVETTTARTTATRTAVTRTTVGRYVTRRGAAG